MYERSHENKQWLGHAASKLQILCVRRYVKIIVIMKLSVNGCQRIS